MQQTQIRFKLNFRLSCYVDQATTKRICEDPDIADGKLVTEYNCFPERASCVFSPRASGEDHSAGLITLIDPCALIQNDKPSTARRELFPDSFFATIQSSFEVTQSTTPTRIPNTTCTEPPQHTLKQNSYLLHTSQCPSSEPSPQQGDHRCHQDTQKHHDCNGNPSSSKKFPGSQAQQACQKLCTPDFFKNSKNLLSDVHFQFLQSPFDAQSENGGLHRSDHGINPTHPDQSCSEEVSHQTSYLQEEHKYCPATQRDKAPSMGNIRNLVSNASTILTPSEKIQNSTNPSSGWPKGFISVADKPILSGKNQNSTSNLLTSFSSNCWTYNPSVEVKPSVTQVSTDTSPSGWPKCYIIPVADKSENVQDPMSNTGNQDPMSDTGNQDPMSNTGNFSFCCLTCTTSVGDKPLPLESLKSNLLTSFSQNCWTYNLPVVDKASEKALLSTDTSPSGWPKCFIPSEKLLPSNDSQNIAPSASDSLTCCQTHNTSVEDKSLPSEKIKGSERGETTSSVWPKCYTSFVDKHSLGEKIHDPNSNPSASSYCNNTSVAVKLLPSEWVQSSASSTNAFPSDSWTSNSSGTVQRQSGNPSDFTSNTSTYPCGFYTTSVDHMRPPGANICYFEHSNKEPYPLVVQTQCLREGPNFGPQCSSLMRPPFGLQAGPPFGTPFHPQGAVLQDSYRPPYRDMYDPSVGFDANHHPRPPAHWESQYNPAYQYIGFPPPRHTHRTYGPDFRPGELFYPPPPPNMRPLPLIPRPHSHSNRPPLMPAPFPLIRPLPSFYPPVGFGPPQEQVRNHMSVRKSDPRFQDAWNAPVHQAQISHTPKPQCGLSSPHIHVTSKGDMGTPWGQEGRSKCPLLTSAGELMGPQLQECSKGLKSNYVSPLAPDQHSIGASSQGTPCQPCVVHSRGNVKESLQWNASITPDVKHTLPSSITTSTQLIRNEPVTSVHTSRDPPMTMPSNAALPTRSATPFNKHSPTEVAAPFTTAWPIPAFINPATSTSVQIAQITQRAPPISSSVTTHILTYAAVCAPPLTTHAPPLNTHVPPLITLASPLPQRSVPYSHEMESERDKQGQEVMSCLKESGYTAAQEDKVSSPSDPLTLRSGPPPTSHCNVTDVHLISFQPFLDLPTHSTSWNWTKEQSNSLKMPFSVGKIVPPPPPKMHLSQDRATKISNVPCKSTRSKISNCNESNLSQLVMKIPKLSKDGAIIMTSDSATLHQSTQESFGTPGTRPDENDAVSRPLESRHLSSLEQKGEDTFPREQDTIQDVKSHGPSLQHPLQQISTLCPPQLDRMPLPLQQNSSGLHPLQQTSRVLHPLQHNKMPQAVPHPSGQGISMPHLTEEYQQQTSIRFQLQPPSQESDNFAQTQTACKHNEVAITTSNQYPSTVLPQSCSPAIQSCPLHVIKATHQTPSKDPAVSVQSDKLHTVKEQLSTGQGIQQQEMLVVQSDDQHNKDMTTGGSHEQHKAMSSISYGFSSTPSCLAHTLVQNASTKTGRNAVQVQAIRYNQNKDQLKSLEKSCTLEVEPQHIPETTATSRVALSKGNAKITSTVTIPEWGEFMTAKHARGSIGKESTLSKPSSCEVILSESVSKKISDSIPAGKDGDSCNMNLDEVDNLDQICSIFQNELEKKKTGSGPVDACQECATPAGKKAARHRKKRGRKKTHHK